MRRLYIYICDVAYIVDLEQSFFHADVEVLRRFYSFAMQSDLCNTPKMECLHATFKFHLTKWYAILFQHNTEISDNCKLDTWFHFNNTCPERN